MASSPKIAYVVNSVNPGGTEKLVVEMSSAYLGELEIDVVCLDEPGEWAADLRSRGIRVTTLWRQPGLDLSMAFALARYCKRHDIDIIHAHQTTPWFYAALSRLVHPRPRLLFEEHGRFFPEVDKPKRRLFNRWLIRRLTHRTVAVSDDIRRRLQRYEGLLSSEIEVVYNGVRPAERLSAEARAALRASLGFSPGEFVVGTVGRFDPIKNLPLLVEALERCRRERPEILGLLVGDGPELGNVRALLAQRGLSGAVRLTGFRQDARALVQCMDLFVLSSLSEGTSMALLEAMAASVPVVVTAVGGNVEVVEAGVSGWVVPSESRDDMVAAIREAAADEPRRRAVARAGERRFAERFALDSMLERYREIYRELHVSAGGVAALKPSRAQ